MKALVLYHSQEKGNTKKMAEAVAKGMEEAGAEVTLFNTNEGRFDITDFAEYDCAAFGSPDYYSYIAGGLKVFVDDHYIASELQRMPGLRGKTYGLFYSHGGGGKVRGPLQELFKLVGTQVGEPVESNGMPHANVLNRCAEMGRAVVKAAGM
ncbi:MAG: flavodoxin domain-containing protein [Planctomycetes bacterium]|nr:flavodoxin domain-containing protein [Planctomycetota bacterium]